jgi:hypothetical protein
MREQPRISARFARIHPGYVYASITTMPFSTRVG